jgi:hypothetical protein
MQQGEGALRVAVSSERDPALCTRGVWSQSLIKSKADNHFAREI